MPKKNYQERKEIYEKLFHKVCLFCEVPTNLGGETECPTVLNLCQACLKRWEVIKGLEKDHKKNNNDYEQRGEIDDCFKGRCYFCNEVTIMRGFNSSGGIAKDKFYLELVGNSIGACHACYARYRVLCELEQQKQEQEKVQQEQQQAQIVHRPPNQF